MTATKIEYIPGIALVRTRHTQASLPAIPLTADFLAAYTPPAQVTGYRRTARPEWPSCTPLWTAPAETGRSFTGGLPPPLPNSCRPRRGPGPRHTNEPPAPRTRLVRRSRDRRT